MERDQSASKFYPSFLGHIPTSSNQIPRFFFTYKKERKQQKKPLVHGESCIHMIPCYSSEEAHALPKLSWRNLNRKPIRP